MVSTFSFRTSAILVLGLALMVSCQQEEVNPPEAEPVLVNGEEVSTRPPLTGIPQIDYIWDPNLPRELNGFNLSSYPFYRSIPPPDKMQFECDGLHDGFYASVVHKCQVYHQCLFGQRYDFLCANFTAFDQKNFICHFANEVDCKNSPKFFDRNEALYKTTSTTPAPTAPPAVIIRRVVVGEDGRPLRRPGAGRFRRPQANRRPVYYDDYYDEYQDYYDVPGNEEEGSTTSKNATVTDNPANSDPQLEEEAPFRPNKGGRRPGPGGQGNRQNIFNNNRPPPRIRPPVPNSEAKKPNRPAKTTTTTTQATDEFYDYVDYADGEQPIEEVSTTTTTTTTTQPPRRRFRRPKTTTTSAPVVEDGFEEFFEEEPATTTQQPRKTKSPSRKSSTTTTTTTTTTEATPVVEDEQAEQPSRGRNSALFNRRTSINNLLRRRNNTPAATTQQPDETAGNEGDVIEEPVEEVVTEALTTTTTTTAGPLRRTTRARPSRPPNTPRPRPTEAPPVVEEEEVVVLTTAVPVVENVEPAIEAVEAPTRRGRLRRPQIPVVEEEAPVVRRESQRRVSETAQVDTQVEAEQNLRQSRDLVDAPQSTKTLLEESTNFDEELGESQWSIINLFSRVFPQRA